MLFTVIVDDYYIVDDPVSISSPRIGDCNIFTCNPIKYITHKVVAIQASIYLNYGFIFSIQAYCYKIRLLANASFLNIQYALDYTHMYVEFKINEI